MIRKRGKKRCFNYITGSIALLVWLINCSRYRDWTHWITFQDVAEIPLEDLLQSSVMDIYHTAQQAKIDVRLTLNAHGIKRTGQPLLLSLLVRNLLDNAVRYSPQGSVIDVTLNADNFIVRDNGPGVTPEALARIGERFYRPPGQTATGSGLGLSIVQRIAKLHGMNVEFGNAEQGGFEAKVSW